MDLPRHFLARSQDPVLAYELASGLEIEIDSRRLRISRLGIRADLDGVPPGPEPPAVSPIVLFVEPLKMATPSVALPSPGSPAALTSTKLPSTRFPSLAFAQDPARQAGG
jgi:hypothetical protein